MWLFSTAGFFSVVQKQGGSTLTVRARVREDLDRLRAEHMPELGPTVKHGGTDYPFRATIGRDAFAEGIARLAKAIDYPNFKNETARLFGAGRAKVYGKVWAELRALEQAAPPKKIARAGGPAKHRTRRTVMHEGRRLELAFGGIVMDEAGRVLLFRPKGGYGGVAWSFPKGRWDDPEESPETCARREVLEETGVEAKIIGQVPGKYAGDVTLTEYYLMKAVRDTGILGRETERVAWATPEEARALIAKTPNPRSRARDLDVLKAALSATV